MLRQQCGRCGSRVYFDNWSCLGCGARLALLPDLRHLAALVPEDEGTWVRVGADARDHAADENPPVAWRLCVNSVEHGVCNGVVPAHDPAVLCRACEFTQQIPMLSTPAHIEYWRRLERAKRRLLFTLSDLGLPLEPRSRSPQTGLAFSFGEDFPSGHRFMTAHASGVISVNTAEADDVERERIRTSMGEHYRTLLGHFRHESGHYFLERFTTQDAIAHRINATFGDVHAGYDQALESYHAGGGGTSAWTTQYISAYATAHPQEDWSETWAHYLLIIDTLQSAEQLGVELAAGAADEHRRALSPFDTMVERWLPLAELANELARSLGSSDIYPFVLTGPVLDKLRLIDELVGVSAHRTREREMPLLAHAQA